MASAQETATFEAFRAACPDFAGRELRCEPGADPPGFLGTDADGRRVGIELGEWLNPQQMAKSVSQEREEESFTSILKSEEEEPPQNVGFAVMSKAAKVVLHGEDAHQFREEAFACVQDLDSRWENREGWEGRQRFWANELEDYPCLGKYLASVTFFPRRGMPRVRGVAWLTFEGRGGAYTYLWALEALLDLLRKKTNKYGDLHREQRLAELYLVAYYDRGLIHNCSAPR